MTNGFREAKENSKDFREVKDHSKDFKGDTNDFRDVSTDFREVKDNSKTLMTSGMTPMTSWRSRTTPRPPVCPRRSAAMQTPTSLKTTYRRPPETSGSPIALF